MIHKHFEPNNTGTDYVVGDIHGCYATFMAAFDKLNFNPETDRMFSVGDLVDRGAHSPSCVDLLKLPYFHAVRGNHEQMPIDYMDCQDDYERHRYQHNYICNGGEWFLDLHHDLQKVIADKFRELPIVITVGDVAIMHADPVTLNFEKTIELLTSEDEYTQENAIHCAIWERTYVNFQCGDGIVVQGIDRMFLGHTPQPKGVLVSGNLHFIDTGSVFGHALTICKLDGTVVVSEPNIDGRYKSKHFR
jgi:serine/threonine protein phosphatase 1